MDSICKHTTLLKNCDECQMLTLILCLKKLKQNYIFKDLYKTIYTFLPYISYDKIIHLKTQSELWYENNNVDDDMPEVYYFPHYKDTDKYWVEDGKIDSIHKTVKCVIFTTNEYKWNDLIKLPKSVETLYLSHDSEGILSYNGDNPVKVVIDVLTALPNVFWIEFCGYDSVILKSHIKEAAEFCNRKIYIKASTF